MTREELLKKINDLLDEYESKPKNEIQDGLWLLGTRVTHTIDGDGTIIGLDKRISSTTPYYVHFDDYKHNYWVGKENLTKL